MNRFVRSFLIAFTIALLGGCASAPYMPLGSENPKLDASKPLYLMTVTLKNEYKQRWQPRVLNVILKKEGPTEKPEVLIFRMDSQGTIASIEDNGSQTFLVRFTTNGSPSTLVGMNAMASAFPIHGFYFVPVHSNVAANSSGVLYLGAIKAVIRERKDNEFRAGPVIPLIDQAFAGASGGTFDIEIRDSYESDVERFKLVFPALKDALINKAILAPWNRATAQSEWDKN